MKRSLQSSVIALTVLVGLGVGPEVSCASTAPLLPTQIGCMTSAQVRPSKIELSCADDNMYFDHAVWATWSTTATGTARYMRNRCTPDCASSSVTQWGVVKLTASDPKLITGKLIFTKLSAVAIGHSARVEMTWSGPARVHGGSWTITAGTLLN